MTTRTATHVITAPEAAELAGITYRQLDYWARRGWVAPSIDRGTGRAARRLYSADDVVRLAALGHFGRARADVGELGPRLGAAHLPEDDIVIVAGPGAEVAAVPIGALRAHISTGGPYLVFDPAPLRQSLEKTSGRHVRGDVEAQSA